MTGHSHRRIAPLSFLCVLFVCAVSVRAAEPWPELTKALGESIKKVAPTFDALYGDEIAKVTKSRSGADDALLAKRLLVMAERSVQRPALMGLAAQHAFDLGLRDPRGFETAEKAIKLLTDNLPADTHTMWKGKLNELRRRQFDLAEGPQKEALAASLLAELTTAAEELEKAGEWTKAAKSWKEVGEMATIAGKDSKSFTDRSVDAREKAKAIADAQERARMEAEAMARAKAEEDARKKRDALRARMMQAIVDRDDPRTALPLARKLEDTGIEARLILAIDPIEELEPAPAADLGRWYLSLATEHEGDARTRMMIRAWRYFHHFLNEYEGRDKKSEDVRFSLDALTKDLLDVNVDPNELVRLGRPARVTVETFVNDVGMRLAKLPDDRFQMGSPDDEPGRRTVELQHPVTLTEPFYIGVAEVTQAQWRKVMGDNPSKHKGDDRPVDSVTWAEADDFCRKLGAMDGRVYRLPTEAEWEYACRAGTAGRYADNSYYPDSIAWYDANGDDASHDAATRLPNAWGLYDMHGNVSEWCADYVGLYLAERAVDPTGPAEGTDRILRGGSYASGAEALRSAARAKAEPTRRSPSIGFRIVMVAAPKEAPKPPKDPTPPTDPKPDESDGNKPKDPTFFGIPTGK